MSKNPSDFEPTIPSDEFALLLNIQCVGHEFLHRANSMTFDMTLHFDLLDFFKMQRHNQYIL